METDIKNLLIVGIDSSPIAYSAKEAGYEIHVVDYFGDVDLLHVCSRCETVIKQRPRQSCGRLELKFKPEIFLEMSESLLQKYDIDALLLGSGLDDNFDILHELNDMVQILGNSPEVFESVRKKPDFFQELDHLKIPHPKTIVVGSLEDAKAAAVDIGFPVVLKPMSCFAGIGIKIVPNSKEIERVFPKVSWANGTVLVQELINGVHGSVSILATRNQAKVLTLNEQMLGLSFLFQKEPFGYCGNIVPLLPDDSVCEDCVSIAEKISIRFGLKGSNGIDFVISDEGTPYVMEVNPRFQGTLSCVERVLGMNLVEAHVNACLLDTLPTVEKSTSTFCTRLILYAPKRVSVPDLTRIREVRDTPLPGAIIEEGEPLCSVFVIGDSRDSSVREAEALSKKIYAMLQPA
ncbi:ATP-grasp domain-containing protein [Candidatus Bathyarchaeota archaeon]|nr:ATP-grasp domain-containing protein [Candidatus Bathyarchaeota archaeon]